jgi:hypothetical protein
VGSYSLQPGTDTADEFAKLNPPIDGHPDGHGTYMAMMMAAPQNGWGMVGIAPTSVRVYNVKALPAGERTFPFSYYSTAINYCQKQAPYMGLKVVNLSLGNGQSPSSGDLATLQNYVASARSKGNLNVVAAAGNTDGAVEYPAAVTGVFAVGGTDASPGNPGVFCSFSNRGPQLQVLAPACGSQNEPGGAGGLDMSFEDDGSAARGQGTSEASAEVSSVLASIRAYGPTITVSQAEECVTSTEVRGGNLDVASAFRACSLGSVVDRGDAAYRAANTTPATAGGATPEVPTHGSSAPTATPKPMLLPLPRIGPVSFNRHTLAVHALNLPRDAEMTVRVARRIASCYTIVAKTTVASPWARLHVAGWDRIIVRFVEPAAKMTPSPPATVARTHRETRFGLLRVHP